MTDAAPRRHGRTAAVLQTFRQEIVSGRYSAAEMLPGERDLAAELSVSRTTLRRMIADLVDEGLLRHRQGVGTFLVRQRPEPVVDPPRAHRSPARLPGFAEDMRSRGLVLTTQEIARSIVLPTPDEAMMLACSPEETVIRLVRSRKDGAHVLVVEQATVPCRFVDRLEAIGASLYATLEGRGFPPVRALQRLQAVSLGEIDALRLGVEPGSAGVVVRRTAYLANGACCEFTRSTYSGRFYDGVTEIMAYAGAGRGGA